MIMNELDRLNRERLPARGAIEGRIVEDPITPGKYGWAMIGGVQFAVSKIEMKLGAIIFECTLTKPARYAFTIEPGSPARIRGVDGTLIADYAVPGISDGLMICDVRKGDLVTIYLPLRFGEIGSASPEDRQRFNNLGVSDVR